MPQFQLVPLEEAIARTTTGRRAEITREYLSYIEQLKEGEAGRLQAVETESVAAVRRRLGTAAKLAGKELVIKRAGDEVYFWVQPVGLSAGRRRRGRPRRVTTS